MNKVVSPIVRSTIKDLISLEQLRKFRQTPQSVLTIEIGKQPTTIFKNSLWVGYRNGGMASWVSSLLPQLQQQQFVLYMDEESYRGSEYMYSYYSEYFSKLFHKEYKGVCVYPRRLISTREMAGLNQIKAQELRSYVDKSQSSTVFLDLRNADIAAKDSLSKVIRESRKGSYLNMPLNDEDFVETFKEKTSHMSPNTQFITLCAKGYRSLIGYSLLQLVKPQARVKVCRNPISEVKTEMTQPQKIQTVSYATFGTTLAFS